MDVMDKPERIYNMMKKAAGYIQQQKVLAKKDARRVHIVGNEHDENITIVSCGNALGAAILPMILIKG